MPTRTIPANALMEAIAEHAKTGEMNYLRDATLRSIRTTAQASGGMWSIWLGDSLAVSRHRIASMSLNTQHGVDVEFHLVDGRNEGLHLRVDSGASVRAKRALFAAIVSDVDGLPRPYEALETFTSELDPTEAILNRARAERQEAEQASGAAHDAAKAAAWIEESPA